MPFSEYEKKSSDNNDFTEKTDIVEIEKIFWRSILFNAPLYGADIQGSFFKKNDTFDINNVDSVLNDGL